MHISSNFNAPSLLKQTELSTEVSSPTKDMLHSPFADTLSETSAIDEESKTDRNSLENIQNWILGKSTIEPDEEAVINAIYSNKLKATGLYICTCTLPDGSNFYYPPASASMQDKKDYYNSVKNLTSNERFDVASLIQEKVGIKLTYRSFERISPNGVSPKELCDAIIKDLINALSAAKPNDPNYDFFQSVLNSFRRMQEYYQKTSTKS